MKKTKNIIIKIKLWFKIFQINS